jgi:hypothetical protein
MVKRPLVLLCALLMATPWAAVANPAAANPRVAPLAGATPARATPAGPAAVASRINAWHVVKPGQTIFGIARYYGLRPSDVARWNQIGAPYRLSVDAILRLARPPVALRAWRSRVYPVTAASVGWDPRKRCPVPPSQLRRIWMSYIDFLGRYHHGSIVMHKSQVTRTRWAFYRLYQRRYRIMAMEPIWANMPGQTDTSIVTSGYECRTVAGSGNWSEHAYGRAIDLNPLQNPMVRGRYIDPPAGRGWLDRSRYRIGMVHAEGAARPFTANGFYWGGRWRTLKDYMHFSPTNH